MSGAAILNYEPLELAPESDEGNYQGNGKDDGRSAAVEQKRTRHGRPRSTSKKGHQGKSHGPHPPTENRNDPLVDKIIDDLGPLESEEEEKIREWLRLGS
jgi:hypothetical protein